MEGITARRAEIESVLIKSSIVGSRNERVSGVMSMFQTHVAGNTEVVILTLGAGDKLGLVEHSDAGIAGTAGLQQFATNLDFDL